jgi:hypothetical protein
MDISALLKKILNYGLIHNLSNSTVMNYFEYLCVSTSL